MFDLKKEDSIIINNQTIYFQELFKREINYTPSKYSFLNDKVILVTGGGSIGLSLIKQLLLQDVKKVIVLDHSEYIIFKLQLVLKEYIINKKIELFLGDVRNESFLEKIFNQFSIQIIYHTAAYKHVNILETNENEAVSVNIDGSLKLLEMANKYGVEQYIFVSTDKAVNPVNKMGITKRITELNLIKKIFSEKIPLGIKIIRFGNVFNSSGSVFSIFKYQIENNKNLTLTNSEMKRFFISKYEAAKGLIEIGNSINKSGGYLLDMGNSFKIESILNDILNQLNLDYLPKILYLESENKKIEKLQEDLSYPFEKLEKVNKMYSKISIQNYNVNKIDLEINNLYKILKK